jgi:hypothetical protein
MLLLSRSPAKACLLDHILVFLGRQAGKAPHECNDGPEIFIGVSDPEGGHSCHFEAMLDDPVKRISSSNLRILLVPELSMA